MGIELFLLIIFLFCFLFMIVTQWVFWMRRKLARRNIISDWRYFLDAEKSNDVELLNLYVDKLIWNRYISQDQIDQINKVISVRVENYTNLGDLYNVTKNRRSYLSDDDRLRIYGK